VSNFGHFSPAFYGVTTNFPGEPQLNEVGRYAEEDDITAWPSKLADANLGRLGPISAIDHEIRHFHDALLSPWGFANMSLRTSIMLNAMQTLHALASKPGKFIPTPMARWLQWDEAKRKSWVAGIGRFFGINSIEDIVTLPTVTPENIHALDPEKDLLAYQVFLTVDGEGKLRARQARRPTRFGEGTVSSNDPFECTAHIVQGQAIWTGQGEVAHAEYVRYLLTADLEYLLLFNVLDRALGQPVPIERLLALYTWTLLTPPLSSTDDPAERLCTIIELVITKPQLMVANMSTERFWDYLDALTDLPNWRKNIAEADAAAVRRRGDYARLRASPHGNRLTAAIDVGDLWLSDRATLIARFLANPEAYVSPLAYINAPDGTWQMPALMMRFGAYAVERAAPLRSPRMRAITADAGELKVAAYVVTQEPDRLEPVLDHMSWNMMIDQVFFDVPSTDLIDRCARNWVEQQTGKKLISVY
jgi:hypothetical protein